MRTSLMKPLRVAFVATYPPRQCGIGTFTHDLVKNLDHLYDDTPAESFESRWQVVALNNLPEGYDFPPEVHFEIRDQYKNDYYNAADFLNLSGIDVVSLQHEFGIFGGKDGGHILHLLNNLKKPVITTLHTVLREPLPQQRETLKTLCASSTLVVVLTKKAVEILKEVYEVPAEKIAMIFHGAPDVPFLDPSYYKDQFQAEGRRVFLTFGLLSPNKGIEYAIDAMAKVVKEFPDVLYIVLGATHPEVKRYHGEQYRISLERRVKEKGLSRHVVFHNRFVSLERLVQFLIAADIYVSPYLTREQIVSGTLTYALACGKAVISTPYWHAEELLANERGCLVPFHDSEALAEQLLELLRDENVRNRLRKNAYQYGRQMIWREVANSYAAAFEKALFEYGPQATPASAKQTAVSLSSLPEIKLDHLRVLTDDSGIIQHAIFSTPDRSSGYCADDNARALIVAVMNWQMFNDDRILRLLHAYLAFLNHALDRETNRMRNFMSYDRQWLEKAGSEDSHGRALWSLGYTVAHAPDENILGFANRLFKQAVKPCASFTSPRTWAYCIFGGLKFLQRFGGDTETKNLVSQLGQLLFDLFKNNMRDDWLWCENIVTHANARLPHALLAVGQYLSNDNMVQVGLRALDWLLEIQTNPANGHLSFVGNAGWYNRGEQRAHFDQQPIEAACFIDACHQAYLTTNDKRWWSSMENAFAWFLGKNDLQQPVCDFITGGCFDGLHPGGVNLNQGAESTLCWLYALHLMHQVFQEGTHLAEGSE